MEQPFENIKVKMTDEKPCVVTLSVQIPGEFVRAKTDKVAGEFQRVAQLPGFRTGKAPVDLVRRNFSGKIESETLEQLLKDFIPQIIREKSISPVSTPTVDQIRYNGGNSLSFNLIIERNPDVKIKNYKSISVTKKTKKIGDEDVSHELDQLRERNSQLVPSKSETADMSHYAVISYQASHDGQPIPDLKAESQMINLSAPQTIQGFAEGIIGQAKGQTKDIPIEFPKEYPRQDLAGKSVTFQVTLSDLKEKIVPALDDELAKDFELGSLDDLKLKIRESLERSYEKSSRSDVEKQIFDKLIQENPLPVPDSLVNMQLESLLNQAKDYMSRQGTKADTSEKEAELKERYRPQAERQVRLSYILSGIARQESLKAGKDDWTIELEKTKASNPDRASEIEEYFQKHESLITSQISDEKVIKFLTEKAKMKEVTE